MEEAEGASPGKAKLTAAELSRRARRISIEQEANAERARLRLTRHDLENLIANAGAERPLQSKAEVHGEVQFASKIDDVAKRHEALTAGLGRYLGERLLELQTELEAARLETYFSNPGVHEQLKPQLRAEHEALNGALQGLLHTVYASFSQALDAFVQTQKDWSSAQATIIGSVHALARELYVDSIAQARGRDTAARSTATSRVEQARSAAAVQSRNEGAALQSELDLKLAAMERRYDMTVAGLNEQIVSLQKDVTLQRAKATAAKEDASARVASAEAEAHRAKESQRSLATELARVKLKLDEYRAATTHARSRTEKVSESTHTEFENRVIALEVAGREAVRATELKHTRHTEQLRSTLGETEGRLAVLRAEHDELLEKHATVRAEYEGRMTNQAAEISRLQIKAKELEELKRKRDEELRKKLREREHALTQQHSKEVAVLVHDRDEARTLLHSVRADNERLKKLLNAKSDDLVAERSAASAQSGALALSIAWGERLEAELGVVAGSIADADAEWYAERLRMVKKLAETEHRLAQGTELVRAEFESELTRLADERDMARAELVVQLREQREASALELGAERQRALRVELELASELLSTRKVAQRNGDLCAAVVRRVEWLCRPGFMPAELGAGAAAEAEAAAQAAAQAEAQAGGVGYAPSGVAGAATLAAHVAAAEAEAALSVGGGSHGGGAAGAAAGGGAGGTAGSHASEWQPGGAAPPPAPRRQSSSVASEQRAAPSGAGAGAGAPSGAADGAAPPAAAATPAPPAAGAAPAAGAGGVAAAPGTAAPRGVDGEGAGAGAAPASAPLAADESAPAAPAADPSAEGAEAGDAISRAEAGDAISRAEAGDRISELASVTAGSEYGEGGGAHQPPPLRHYLTEPSAGVPHSSTPVPLGERSDDISHEVAFVTHQLRLARRERLHEPPAATSMHRVDHAVSKWRHPRDTARISGLQKSLRTQGLRLTECHRAIERGVEEKQEAERSAYDAQLKLQSVAFHLHRFLGGGSSTLLQQRAGTAPPVPGRPGAGTAASAHAKLSGTAHALAGRGGGGGGGGGADGLGVGGGAPPTAAGDEGEDGVRCLACGAPVLDPALLNLLHDPTVLEGGHSTKGPRPATPAALQPPARPTRGSVEARARGERALVPGQTLQQFMRQQQPQGGASPPPPPLGATAHFPRAPTPHAADFPGGGGGGGGAADDSRPNSALLASARYPPPYGPGRARSAVTLPGNLYTGLSPRRGDPPHLAERAAERPTARLPPPAWMQLRPGTAPAEVAAADGGSGQGTALLSSEASAERRPVGPRDSMASGARAQHAPPPAQHAWSQQPRPGAAAAAAARKGGASLQEGGAPRAVGGERGRGGPAAARASAAAAGHGSAFARRRRTLEAS